ncbi:type I restriction endonuclease subunit R [Elizabethkingia meningoseptica]|uniref:type I restriction endonuclease subunit R n=1 Tax=Elizabethkingia meningoseptica TaxID=238 RepID=UPI0023B1E21A|nr:DEAD/DEAH box helicase family protein [Elizabethkingia meningoseptica]MDE5492782.1 DEAD/DEAH box helicase family protein [Elizabethkingia meningoseptica]
MAAGTNETAFEAHVVSYLVNTVQEYQEKHSSTYNKDLCLIEEDVIAFIQDTQPDEYRQLHVQYGMATNQKIVENVAKSINANKTLQVLREGLIKDRGIKLQMAYFKPNHNRSPEHLEKYNKNRLTIVRQLGYSNKNNNELDLGIFINGIPVATAELKNALTGQYLSQAIEQYRNDRDSKEKLFEFQRCLVHFAVSTEKIAMTTRLTDKNTFFLPFDKDLENSSQNDFATSYWWQDVLRKDSLLDLIQNFVNLQTNEEKIFSPKTNAIETKRSEVLIFPRFHQRRVVKRLLADVKEKGVGQKYLIQHSAGSGKSNTISWLAHRLSDTYQNPSDRKSLFDTTIVVTDRRVLDKQIQNNIRQFEQTPGAVAYIDENKTAQDLRIAIENGSRIIVTTLQKFPVISESVAHFSDRTFAVIIDEAHSSQAGEAARHLRKTLSLEEAAERDVIEKSLDDIIEDEILSKGDQKNISFFAFTATPKNKTLEIFGTKNQAGDKTEFDLYSMEQAIKEGFILDVLKNYMSWRRYYKLVKRSEVEDKEYSKKQTLRLLANYVDLQDHAIEKKTRIMLEHFASQTQNEIQGMARAMLVTKSRLHAVRYKLKFDEITREMNLPYEALVAFSGTVTDGDTGAEHTMSSMNQLEGKISVPEALKLPKYRILIVANMYQTGFDEPLLQTMFVDKKLGGTSTVQTLSRLNRTRKGKDSTMVLDFVNEPEKVQQDFQFYYGSNHMDFGDQTDQNSVYDVLNKIESFNLIYQNDVDAFANIFFRKGDNMELLQPILNNLVERYKDFEEEVRIEVKTSINDFIRLYRFLSQIITFTDVDLEKYYVLLTALFKKLPSNKNVLPTDVLENVELDSYKLQHQYTTDLQLESANANMQGQKPGGATSSLEDEFELLTKIIKVLNDTFGLDLKEEDKVDFMKMKDSIYQNEELMSFFNKNNSKANIQDKFDETIDDELLNFIDGKLNLYNKLTDDRVNKEFKRLWFNEIYDKILRSS